MYLLLGVPRQATGEQIRRAYRKLALKHHPDKNPDDPTAADRFREVSHAHGILGDDRRRSIYDDHGSVGIYVAEKVGEENADLFLRLQSAWCKAFFVLCGMLTFCYCCCFCCCCCFNFCCGKCVPRNIGDEPSAQDLEEEELEEAVTSQPKGEDGPGQVP